MISLVQEFENALIVDRVASRVTSTEVPKKITNLKQLDTKKPTEITADTEVVIPGCYLDWDGNKGSPSAVGARHTLRAKSNNARLRDLVIAPKSKTASGMRECTMAEYQQALAKAKWPEPRYMNTKRIMTKLYTEMGVEVAQMTEISTRGKKPQVSYMCNPDYLT
jgi:hypothetical protein